MNLTNLIAPDQGKVQPVKDTAAPKGDDDAGTEFASLVSEQSGDEPQTQSNQTGSEQSIATPTEASVRQAPEAKPSAIADLVSAIENPEALDQTESAEATSPLGAAVQVASPTLSDSGEQSDAVATGKSADTALASQKAADTVPTRRTGASSEVVGTPAQPVQADAQTATSPDVTSQKAAATDIRPQNSDTADSKPADVANVPRDRQIVLAESSGRTDTSDLATARSSDVVPATLQPGKVPVASGAAGATVSATVQPPTQQAPVRPAPRAALTDDARAKAVADETPIDVKVTDRTFAKIADGADLADLPRAALRSIAPSGASNPVQFGADVTFGAPPGTASTQTTSTPPLDLRLAFPEPRALAQHVAPQIVNALSARAPGTVIDVTLDPPELGRIEIMLDFAENGIRASLATERQATGDLLRRHLEILSQHFEDAGFANVDLSFGDPRGGTSGAASGGNTADDPLALLSTDPSQTITTHKNRSVAAAGGGIDILL